jgi:hypothetical protein
MMAMVSAAAARVGDSAFGHWCGKVGDIIDCAIPIVLLIAIIAGMGAIWLGYVPVPAD